MRTYIVYCEWEGELLGFECQADDSEHAEEQCINAYPGCEISDVIYAEDANFSL